MESRSRVCPEVCAAGAGWLPVLDTAMLHVDSSVCVRVCVHIGVFLPKVSES